MFFDEDEIDLNAYKTNVIMSLYNFISFFNGDTEQFGAMIYKILCLNTEEEVFELELDLFDDDITLEKILTKQKINREKVVSEKNWGTI